MGEEDLDRLFLSMPQPYRAGEVVVIVSNASLVSSGLRRYRIFTPRMVIKSNEKVRVECIDPHGRDQNLANLMLFDTTLAWTRDYNPSMHPKDYNLCVRTLVLSGLANIPNDFPNVEHVIVRTTVLGRTPQAILGLANECMFLVGP